MNINLERASNADPRHRLLEAAGEMFAERGFRGTTVREICRRAGTNIATVNYYFGSKEKLYSAVLQYSLIAAIKKYPPDLGLGENATPEDRLEAFVQSLMLRLLDEGRPAWHGKLMSREIVEPTFALDALVKEVIRPLSGRLQSIVGAVLGPRASQEEIRLCAESISGQCLHYRHARAVIARLYPEQKYSRDGLKRLGDHITRFSLAALKQFKKENIRRTRGASQR